MTGSQASYVVWGAVGVLTLIVNVLLITIFESNVTATENVILMLVMAAKIQSTMTHDALRKNAEVLTRLLDSRRSSGEMDSPSEETS
jgi:hypothetical protein